MRAVEWQNSFIGELDITSTELNEETLRDVLLRMPGFTYLAVGYCEFFSDQVRGSCCSQMTASCRCWCVPAELSGYTATLLTL